MAAKMGRPIAGDEPKNRQIAMRATESTVRKLQVCSDLTGKTKTELMEKMVTELYDSLMKMGGQ